MIRPPMLPEPFRQSLTDGLHALYGERLAGVHLFGSYTCGGAHSESDVDILVVLAGEVNRVAESWRLADLSLDLMAAHGLVPGFVTMGVEEFETASWQLLQNVRRESVPLLAA